MANKSTFPSTLMANLITYLINSNDSYLYPTRIDLLDLVQAAGYSLDTPALW